MRLKGDSRAGLSRWPCPIRDSCEVDAFDASDRGHASALQRVGRGGDGNRPRLTRMRRFGKRAATRSFFAAALEPAVTAEAQPVEPPRHGAPLLWLVREAATEPRTL